MIYFSSETLDRLAKGRGEVHDQFAELQQRYILRSYLSEKGRQFALQGFGRRLGVLVRAIDQVFHLLPPEMDGIPARDTVVDATIAIQAFVLNAFGCLDNLAWIWVYEKGILSPDGTELPRGKVGLGPKYLYVRSKFSEKFRAYLDSRSQWIAYLTDFRDALAHRVPLYIPPFIVSPDAADEYARLEKALSDALRMKDFERYDALETQQKALGRFRPWMTHSAIEQSPMVVFHVQLIADYVTIDEFGRMMLEELSRPVAT